MSTSERLVGLVPSLALFTYFFAGVAVYSVLRRSIPADHEASARPPSVFLGTFLVQYYFWVLGPVERAMVRIRLSPDALTWIGLLMSVLAGLAFGMGYFSAGGWLYLGNGTLDILDGRVARRTGRQSHTGAFFDSVVDRYAEFFVFAGIVVYYRDRLALMLTALMALLGSLMVSYTRARGESLGVVSKIGSMQRPERILYLGVAATGSPIVVAILSPADPRPAHHLTAAMLAMLAVTANWTALRRFLSIQANLDNSAPPTS